MGKIGKESISVEKNSFLIINELISHLYAWENIDAFQNKFFSELKLLIPFSYASLILCDKQPASSEFSFQSPICYPSYFQEAEQEYLNYIREDPILWILHSEESQIIRESDLIEEEKRLNSSIYIRCYRKYNIYDTLQYTIVYQRKMLGVLTLFRTRADGSFSDDDMFFLRSLGLHLNAVIHRLCCASEKSRDVSRLTADLCRNYHLTAREEQILALIYSYRNNTEIAETLGISEHTLQKHIQNIFRKMNVSSKWELLRFQLSHS